MPPFFWGFLPYGENRSLLQTVSSGRYSFFAGKAEAVMLQAARYPFFSAYARSLQALMMSSRHFYA